MKIKMFMAIPLKTEPLLLSLICKLQFYNFQIKYSTSQFASSVEQSRVNRESVAWKGGGSKIVAGLPTHHYTKQRPFCNVLFENKHPPSKTG